MVVDAQVGRADAATKVSVAYRFVALQRSCRQRHVHTTLLLLSDTGDHKQDIRIKACETSILQLSAPPTICERTPRRATCAVTCVLVTCPAHRQELQQR